MRACVKITTRMRHDADLLMYTFCVSLKALINTTDQQIYCDLVAGEEDNTFLKE